MSTGRYFTVVALLSATVMMAGCLQVKSNTEAEDSRITVLQDDIQRLKREMTELKGPQGTGQASVDQETGKKLAEALERLRQSETDIQTLKGRIEVLEKDLTEQKAQNPQSKPDKLNADIQAVSTRLDGLSERVAALAKSVEALGAAPKNTNTLPAATAGAQKGPKELYDEAYALYRENKYADAQAKFREYVERYPDTQLTDNAIFWIGEAYYDQGQYEQAILQYDKVVQKFPGGDKVASSLLKQAFSFAALGDNVSARILLKKVIQEHQGSEQASIAKKKLEILGE